MNESPAKTEVPRRSWFWTILQMLLRIATTLMFDLKVWGIDNVPPRGGVLLLANHQSYLDPILVSVRLRRPVSFMAKQELFEGSAFFNWLIRSLHAFPVKRGTADVGAIKQAISRLHEGNILNMYPEGTRSLDGEIRTIQPGIALVVKRANVPVVPVIIDGSFYAWPKGGKLLRKHPIRILYGPPLPIDGLRPTEILKLIETTFRSMLIEVRRKGK